MGTSRPTIRTYIRTNMTAVSGIRNLRLDRCRELIRSGATEVEKDHMRIPALFVLHVALMCLDCVLQLHIQSPDASLPHQTAVKSNISRTSRHLFRHDGGTNNALSTHHNRELLLTRSSGEASCMHRRVESSV